MSVVGALPGGEVLLLAVLVAGALVWYLTSLAARLDRLHHKVAGSRAALDAALVRRAEAAVELAGSGLLDPASSLLLAGATTAALDAQEEEREAAESDLTEVLREVLASEEAVERVTAAPGGAALLASLDAACRRVPMARRFSNEAVTQVQRLRRKRVVRWARLAGRAPVPTTFECDDDVPALVRVAPERLGAAARGNDGVAGPSRPGP